jgi:two-component system response regulator (stage 0 sporulation protein F)
MKRKILLVDDEKGILIFIGGCIEKWDYDLITASSGKEAIEALKNESPDIIVLDYKMPEIDGIDTLKKIRALNEEIPVIMFTAFPDQRSVKGSERLGVLAYIPKVTPYAKTEDLLHSAIRLAENELEKKTETQ